ncbi:zf-C2HC5 domain-containing protein [Psidium guajava]|nr:zf-C2HC5 domain-containing protein [Psidium guajava]
MHRLVSNFLSCGRIVCEQEGEGPCQFCGALVLKEGGQYAGLTEAEVAAEGYAKWLVEYDQNLRCVQRLSMTKAATTTSRATAGYQRRRSRKRSGPNEASGHDL